MMVLLGRAMLSSYRLSTQTTVVFGTVWLQFFDASLSGGCEPQFGGRVVLGVGDGSSE